MVKHLARLAGIGAAAFFVPHLSPARSEVDHRCNVFPSPEDRAGCACALEQGGWVTKVDDRWRWIYPKRHQERHCHRQLRKDGGALK